ncbi:hypothetical protein NPIL_136681 [Nephila pilipes]|uniref:Uncharacterized protein n=1 Tax=Nephila pilipes TaxID=299642 RepID=A0A8X6UCP7_NEPPI|nr:hypothetical protein NPIL_136681 [Nephila pilipes]
MLSRKGACAPYWTEALFVCFSPCIEENLLSHGHGLLLVYVRWSEDHGQVGAFASGCGNLCDLQFCSSKSQCFARDYQNW